ncbi:hypothetical protein [Gelidibacter sp.]|uniref:hypothetical protein n=1 Tax=Gelidibacter sp. TaxID=2018083 RepID=UPI002D7E2F15|nr:hypothetical protein [Gelidibacter sp.]
MCIILLASFSVIFPIGEPRFFGLKKAISLDFLAPSFDNPSTILLQNPILPKLTRTSVEQNWEKPPEKRLQPDKSRQYTTKADKTRQNTTKSCFYSKFSRWGQNFVNACGVGGFDGFCGVGFAKKWHT